MKNNSDLSMLAREICGGRNAKAYYLVTHGEDGRVRCIIQYPVRVYAMAAASHLKHWLLIGIENYEMGLRKESIVVVHD